MPLVPHKKPVSFFDEAQNERLNILEAAQRHRESILDNALSPKRKQRGR